MRITKKMKDEYAKIKAATRRKVRNTVKNQGALIHDVQNGEVVTYDIRSKLEIPSIESFRSKKDFDAWMYEQRKFTSGRSPHAKFTKNEHGTVMTDYLKLVLQNRHHEAEKVRKKEASRLEAKGLGEVAERESIMLKNPTLPAFNPIKLNFNALWNKGDIERKLSGLIIKGSPEYYTHKKQTFKDNFIEALRNSNNNDVDDLIRMIQEIPASDLYELYEHSKLDNRPWEVMFLYNVDGIDNTTLDRTLGNIYTAIGEYAESRPEYLDLLKGF